MDLWSSNVVCLGLVYRHGIQPYRGEFEKREDPESATPTRRIRTPGPLAKNLICCSRVLSRQFLSLGVLFDGLQRSLQRMALASGIVKQLHLTVAMRLDQWYFPNLAEDEDPSLVGVFDPNCWVWMGFQNQPLPRTVNGRIYASTVTRRLVRWRLLLRNALRCLNFWLGNFAQDPFLSSQLCALHLGQLLPQFDLPSFPQHLRRLSLGKNFNRNLRGKLPSTITHLSVGPDFDRPFGPDDLPHLRHFHMTRHSERHGRSNPMTPLLLSLSPHLRCLKIAPLFQGKKKSFHQAVFRFASLQKITCPVWYVPQDPNILPLILRQSLFSHPSLRQIVLKNGWGGDVEYWPLWNWNHLTETSHLVSLTLPANLADNLIQGLILPPTLQRLIFHPKGRYNYPFFGPLGVGKLPAGLSTLFMNDSYDSSIDCLATRTPRLKRLRLGPQFHQPILHLPPSLVMLIVGDTPLCTPKWFPSLDLARELEPFTLLGGSSYESPLPLLPMQSPMRLIMVGICRSHNKERQNSVSIYSPPGCPSCTVIGRIDLFDSS